MESGAFHGYLLTRNQYKQKFITGLFLRLLLQMLPRLPYRLIQARNDLLGTKIIQRFEHKPARAYGDEE